MAVAVHWRDRPLGTMLFVLLALTCRLTKIEGLSAPTFNVIGVEGSNVTLYCNREGGTGSYVTWEFLHDNSGDASVTGIATVHSSGTFYPDSTTAWAGDLSSIDASHLIIHRVRLDRDDGYLRCSLGIENLIIKLTVQVPVTTVSLIPANSIPLSTEQTEPTIFTCTVTSKPKATVTWELVKADRSTVTLSPARESSTTHNKLITMISRLSYRPQKEHNGDSIRCTAQNIANTSPVVSHATRVTIHYPPDSVRAISGYTTPVTESNTESLHLICSVNGVPNPNNLAYTWSSDCGTGEKSESQISVPRTRTMNNKQCYCTVTHSETNWQRDSRSVTFNIHYVPDVAVSISSADMTEGGSTQLECHPSAVPDNYTYIDWTQTVNGVRVREFTGSKVLNLNNLTFENSGEYRCGVNNIVGAGTGSNSLHIKYAPQLVEVGNFSAGMNATARLSLKFIGDPQPNVTWYKDESDSALNANLTKFSYTVIATNVIWTFYETSVTIRGYEATLIIHSVQEQDYAAYHATLDNGLKMHSQIPRFSAHLMPNDKPQPPVDFEAVCDVTTAVVSWVSHFDGGLTQTFHLSYLNNGQRVALSEQDPGKGNSGTVKLETLEAGINYTFAILSRNKIGDSETVNTSCQTKEVVSVPTTLAEKDSSITVVAVAISVPLVFIIVLLITVICFVMRRLKLQTMKPNMAVKNAITLSDVASTPPQHMEDDKDAPYDEIHNTYDVILNEDDATLHNYSNQYDNPALKNDVSLQTASLDKDDGYINVVPALAHPTPSEPNPDAMSNTEPREYETTSFGDRSVQYKNTRSEAEERCYEKLKPAISTEPSNLNDSPYENKMVDLRIVYENV